jgi:nucleoporin-like protein 2
MAIVAKKQQEQQTMQQNQLFQQPQKTFPAVNPQQTNNFFQQPGFAATANQQQQPQASSLFTQFKPQLSQPQPPQQQGFFTNFNNQAAPSAQNTFLQPQPANLASMSFTSSQPMSSSMSFLNSQTVVQQQQPFPALTPSNNNSFLPKMDSNSSHGSFYSNMNELQKHDIDEFKENMFRIGRIPYNPPARELC